MVLAFYNCLNGTKRQSELVLVFVFLLSPKISLGEDEEVFMLGVVAMNIDFSGVDEC